MAYSDYPQAMSNNAKTGQMLNQRQGGRCATAVGKETARILVGRRPLSKARVKRMHAYLQRAETYYDPKDRTACGTISYLLWGGLAAKRWAAAKVREIDAEG